VDGKKKFVIMEAVNSALYAYLACFHGCHELLKNFERTMCQRQQLIQHGRTDFQRDAEEWLSLRQTFHQQLQAQSHARLVGATMRVGGGGAEAENDGGDDYHEYGVGGGVQYGGGSAGGGVGDGAAGVSEAERLYASKILEEEDCELLEVLSSEQRRAREEEKKTKEAKQGFMMFKEKEKFGKWRRAWFQIHDGKLYTVNRQVV
jgi:hypothetical protein